MAAHSVTIPRRPGKGWLALIGGGEFSFEETEAADAAWLAKCRRKDGTVGFIPAASGSTDYGNHFAVYLDEYFERQVETIPVYRARDARRGKNAERIASVDDLYFGGGVCDHLLDALSDTPCLEAIQQKIDDGATVVAIAAAAQAFGEVVRSIFEQRLLDGLGWLPGVAVDTNFDPGHVRRLRQLMARPTVHMGLGITAESALLLGPDGEHQVVGNVYLLESADADLTELGSSKKS